MPQFNQERYDWYMDNLIPGYGKYKYATHTGEKLPEPSEEIVKEYSRRFEWMCAFDGVAPSKIPLLSNYNKPKKKHRFITISLPKEMESKTVHETWIAFMKKHRYTDKVHSWTYEFTSKEKEYHPHIHVLMMMPTATPQKGTIIRDIATKFRIDKNYVDVRTHTSPEIFSKREKYIRGEKTDEKKFQIESDQEIRALNDLKEFYINNI